MLPVIVALMTLGFDGKIVVFRCQETNAVNSSHLVNDSDATLLFKLRYLLQSSCNSNA